MDRHNVIPQHIAIIMDGNGRWAKQRGKDRSEGHFAGMMALKQTVMAAAQKGVKWLTVYAFSTENWGRPQAEVDALMDLFRSYMEKNGYVNDQMRNDVYNQTHIPSLINWIKSF